LIEHNLEAADNFHSLDKIDLDNSVESHSHHRHRILLTTAEAVVDRNCYLNHLHNRFDCNIISIIKYMINFVKKDYYFLAFMNL
jgi:hypothetical protein